MPWHALQPSSGRLTPVQVLLRHHIHVVQQGCFAMPADPVCFGHPLSFVPSVQASR